MRGLLTLACRAFPPDHRARRSDEVLDTALLVADGSRRRATREALSLVRVGVRARVRRESKRPFRDGLWPLAVVLAVLNLAVAFVAAAAERAIPIFAWRSLDPYISPYPYRPDWWWIAVTVAAAAVVMGLILGDRRLALGAALSNLGLLTYAASVSFHPLPFHGPELLNRVFYAHAFPTVGQWLALAVVLSLAATAAPLRRLPLSRVPLAAAVVAAVVILSHETHPWGDFLFLRWPLVVLMLLTIAFGSLMPRLTVLTVGVVLATIPSGFALSAGSSFDRAVIWSVTAGFALAAFVPVVRLVRRRVT